MTVVSLFFGFFACYDVDMYLDLSVPINEDTPVYPGDPKAVIKPAGVLKNDGYCDHFVSMGTHVGTHVDAPAHMLENGATLEKIDVERFIGRGRLVEVQNKKFDLAAVEAAGIQAGDIVLFRTGMSEKYQDKVYFEDYPTMSEKVAKYLVEAKVSMIGVDTCSVDNQDGFPIHKILLGGDVLIIENLTNLSQLVGKSFKVYALPLSLQIDGSPARVIAEVVK